MNKKLIGLSFILALTMLVSAFIFPIAVTANSNGAEFEQDSPIQLQDRGSCQDLERAGLRPRGFCDGSWKTKRYPISESERKCMQRLGIAALITMTAPTWQTAFASFGTAIFDCYNA